MPYVHENRAYPDESKIVEGDGRCFLCYPGGFVETGEPPRRAIDGELPPWARWARMPIVSSEEDAVAYQELSVRTMLADERETAKRADARLGPMLAALRKLAGSKVSTYTLDELNDLEGAAGLEDVVTGDGQMLKKDRHRLLKKAARGALMDMGK